MSPEDRDLGYIWDIYDSCLEIGEFMQNREKRVYFCVYSLLC